MRGGCLCGEISYEVTARLDRCYVCHCTDCQKRSGSAFAINVPAAASSLEVKGEPIALGQRRREGPPATVYFCASCLTRLYTFNPAYTGFVMLRGGSLDQAFALDPSAHLWIKSKQAWVVIPDGVIALPTQPADAAGWRALLE